MNNKLLKNIIIWSFVSVPVLSSFISTLHLIDLFALGNPYWLAVALAVAIEIGSLASFLTLSILSKLNKGFVWTVFIILFLMQIIGNTYFSYEWISGKISQDSKWVDSFKEMTEFVFGSLQILDIKMYLSILISWPIPVISVFLLKSATEYLGSDDEKEKEEEKFESQEEPITVSEDEPIVEVKEIPKDLTFEEIKREDRIQFHKKFDSENENQEK